MKVLNLMLQLVLMLQKVVPLHERGERIVVMVARQHGICYHRTAGRVIMSRTVRPCRVPRLRRSMVMVESLLKLQKLLLVGGHLIMERVRQLTRTR